MKNEGGGGGGGCRGLKAQWKSTKKLREIEIRNQFPLSETEISLDKSLFDSFEQKPVAGWWDTAGA